MKRTVHGWTSIQVAVALALMAGLTACGGGGGGGGDQPPAVQMIDLTAGNMETAAHAAATGPFALGLSSAADIATGAGPNGAGGVYASILATLRGGTLGERMRVASARVRPLALYSMQQDCLVSGTMTLSWDDRDNNGDLSVGDGMGFTFNGCQNDATQVIDGSANVDLTRIDLNAAELTGFAGRMTMTGLAGRGLDGGHAYTVDGVVLVDFAQSSPTTESMRVTTDGEVTVNVQTHRFTDTVTLLSGYVNASIYDAVQMRGSNTFDGTFRSRAAGGTMKATTPAPFVDLASDAYPSSGTLRVTGNKGTLNVRALSSTDVRIELDGNDDGVFEAGQTETWDWLL
jgi:hypothetical protein